MSGKILIISDLHLGDRRVPPEFEAMRLAELAKFIRANHFAMVLNLGDTVSRCGCLRPGEPGGEASFVRYLQWRKELDVPFRECAIPREISFFETIFHQAPDSVDETLPGVCVVTMTPYDNSDHRFSADQVAFLEKILRKTTAPKVLIGTHVPCPGSCSRTPAPGIFLNVPERLNRAIAKCGKEVYWCGGHFHWNPEPPYHKGNFTAFIGARFLLPGDRPDRTTFLRTFDIDSGAIETIIPGSFLSEPIGK